MKFIPKDEIHAFSSPVPPHMILTKDCVNMFSLNFKLQKRIRQCNPDNSKVFPCVMKSMKNLHKNNEQDLFRDLTDTSYAGYEALHSLTGCRQPCDSFQYETERYMNLKQNIAGWHLVNGTEGLTNWGMVTINHVLTKNIRKNEELLVYTAITFISDVGGILGIFLGFSFWGFALDIIITPILRKFRQCRSF